MKKIRVAILQFLICFFLFSAACFALSDIAPAGETMKLFLGEAKTISVTNPTRIAIGNPAIVDVSQVTKSEISLNPKAIGNTTLIFWDAFGEQSIKLRVVSEDMDEIKRRVDNVLAKFNLAGITSQANDDEGKVFVMGNFKAQGEKDSVASALATLKDKIVDLTNIKEDESVVEIDVQVLELDKDATNTLGFTWPGSIELTEQGSPALGTSSASQVGTTQSINAAASLGSKWSTLFKVLNLSRNQFVFKLDALVQEGKARILSRPRLACQSGKEAQLLVGGEKPVLTTQIASGSGSQGTQVEYKEFGIKLNIRPVVMEEGRIKIGVKVEVSDVGAADILGSSSAPTAKAYPLSKRTANTELFVDNGQTLSIGGLVKQKSEEDLRKVPWLGDVPVLGTFFKQHTKRSGNGTGERGDAELFITITPTIVSSGISTSIPKKKGVGALSIPTSNISEDLTDPVVSYSRIIQKRIMDNLTYPFSAKEAGFQGPATLKLHLSYQGELLDVSVEKSSGYKILDDNAINVAKQIYSYPPFPASVDSKELWIDIPIVYSLN